MQFFSEAPKVPTLKNMILSSLFSNIKYLPLFDYVKYLQKLDMNDNDKCEKFKKELHAQYKDSLGTLTDDLIALIFKNICSTNEKNEEYIDSFHNYCRLTYSKIFDNEEIIQTNCYAYDSEGLFSFEKTLSTWFKLKEKTAQSYYESEKPTLFELTIRNDLIDLLKTFSNNEIETFLREAPSILNNTNDETLEYLKKALSLDTLIDINPEYFNGIKETENQSPQNSLKRKTNIDNEDLYPNKIFKNY